MDRLLYSEMSIDQILDENLRVYDFCYHGSKEVPALSAGGSDTLTIPITSDAHFLCTEITGFFTTMNENADDGVNHISFNITDEGRSIKLFNTFTPANLVFSPGRQRTAGEAGDPGNALFYPKRFTYPFMASSQIVIDLKNNASNANTFSICFWGTKFRTNVN